MWSIKVTLAVTVAKALKCLELIFCIQIKLRVYSLPVVNVRPFYDDCTALQQVR